MKTHTDELERLCVGQWRLFDSTHPADHRIAQAICAECPALEWCEQQRVKVAADSTTTRPMLTGTWAGALYGQKAQRVTAAMDARYTDDEAREARNAADNGDTSDWALNGRRVYDRRKRLRAEAKRGAAA